MSLLGWSPNLPKTPLVDRQGRITSIWQAFLESLYLRVGGASAVTIPEVVSSVTTVVTDLGVTPVPVEGTVRLTLADLAPLPGGVSSEGDLAPVALGAFSEGDLDPRSESVAADFSVSPITWP